MLREWLDVVGVVVVIVLNLLCMTCYAGHIANYLLNAYLV